VTVHLIIKIAQTRTNTTLDSRLSLLYVLLTRGDVRVFARAALRGRLCQGGD
jgi:hypothetical protein